MKFIYLICSFSWVIFALYSNLLTIILLYKEVLHLPRFRPICQHEDNSVTPYHISINSNMEYPSY